MIRYKASRIIAALLVISLLAVGLPTARAYVNLLDNPGFETGVLDPWFVEYGRVWVQTEFIRSGTYAAIMESMSILSQDIDPPQCAGSLEFWYRSPLEFEYPGPSNVEIVYSDGTYASFAPPPVAERIDSWARVYIEPLDTTRQVSRVRIATAEMLEGVFIPVDDFDLEACAAPIITVAGPDGRFVVRIDPPDPIVGWRVIEQINVINLNIFVGSLVVEGELQDPTQEGRILLEVDTTVETLLYEITIQPPPPVPVPEFGLELPLLISLAAAPLLILMYRRSLKISV